MMRMAVRVAFMLALTGFALVAKAQDDRTRFFPRVTEYSAEMPPRENFWLFVLAGQSNMAGRGLVEPSDTVPDNRILYMTHDMRWAVAKEPLHVYQPALTGLGPGLAFARALVEKLDRNIFIGLIPCAVGGSSTENWLTDSVYNGVRLKSNLTERLTWAMKYGTVKGIIWHQGESDATTDKIPLYRENTETLFRYFRSVAGDEGLPVIAGELGLFRGVEKNREEYIRINCILSAIAADDPNTSLVNSSGTRPKADNVHFDAPSQRKMGRRYARAWLSLAKRKNK